MGGGPAAALKAHSALEDSIATHFKDNHAINCMCHSTENIYRWRDTAVARASGGCHIIGFILLVGVRGLMDKCGWRHEARGWSAGWMLMGGSCSCLWGGVGLGCL